nr:MAG TPA: hypothetical protein [Caudoviricetes sp.]
MLCLGYCPGSSRSRCPFLPISMPYRCRVKTPYSWLNHTL